MTSFPRDPAPRDAGSVDPAPGDAAPADSKPADPPSTRPASADLDLEALRAEFPILSERTYLNSCSLGALSRRAESRLAEFTGLWHAMGASAWYEHWLGTVEELRGRVAGFWGSRAEEVALLPSTSAALSVVAESVSAGAESVSGGAGGGAPRRNRVVCTELDFPTLAYQWAVKPEIELVVLESPDGVRIDPEQFEAAVDDRTLFLATSHVFFTTGYVQDLSALADIAHRRGALCLIDGYQGAGQVPLDLSATGVDVYTAGPLKWLCGGPGLAYLYVREDRIRHMEPRITSWFATEDQFAFDLDGFAYRDDARRFELGTPALPTVHTALGAQEILDDVGIDRIAARNRRLTDRLVDGCRGAGFELNIADDAHRSAIGMVAHDDPRGAVAHLAAHGVIVDHRPGYVRASPHVYNTEAEVDRFVEVMAAYRG